MTADLLIPAGYVLALADVCGRWQIDEAALLAEHGLDRDALMRPHMRVGADVLVRILARGVELTGEAGLAVHLGLAMSVSAHGFLGFAALSAPTLGDALQIASRFVGTRIPAVAIEVERDDRDAVVTLRELRPLGALRELAVVVSFISIARAAMMTGGCALDGRAELGFPEPDYYRRLRPMLPGAATFDHAVSRLIFPVEVLDMPQRTADPSALQLAIEQCERELDAVTDHRRDLGRIRALLPRPGGGFRSLEQVADELATSPRTLKRLIAAGGTSFSTMLDDVRRDRALELLGTPDVTLARIADELGFSDTGGFIRAFRRWTGVAPGVYRRQRA
jgi:AraC-like DNA-binding protein